MQKSTYLIFNRDLPQEVSLTHGSIKAAMPWLARVQSADNFVCDSEENKNLLIQAGITHSRIIVLKNGFDLKLFRASEVVKRETK